MLARVGTRRKREGPTGPDSAMDRPIPTMRLYGAVIAFASGGYSVAAASTGTSTRATLMLVLGLVVVVHGAILLTALAGRLGDASGPLMVAYALLMLANQAWPGIGMGGMMMDGGMMAWDPGMVTLALLMLASGVIMTIRREML